MTKAKLFMTGGSLAVRLPAEFRFEESEVDIRRDAVTGEVVLSTPKKSWDELFNWVQTLDLPDDFLESRDDIMIAAHAEALSMTLVTSDAAVKNLKIDGLKIVSW